MNLTSEPEVGAPALRRRCHSQAAGAVTQDGDCGEESGGVPHGL